MISDSALPSDTSHDRNAHGQDADIDEMIRETLRLSAETSLIMARKNLADARKSDLALVWYPALFGAGGTAILFAILMVVLT